MNGNTEAKRPSESKRTAQPSCVVGIGASAGGLEALQQLLTYLPSNTGMAFVIMQSSKDGYAYYYPDKCYIPYFDTTSDELKSIINFYKGRRNYIWKGWCVYNEFKDNK